MEGLVLRLIDYGESDQITRLFLKEAGVISAIAKGIKRSKRRFPHHLEPFRVYSFKFRKKPTQNLYWIQTADQVAIFTGIMEDIRKIALGNFFSEIILKAVKEGHPQPDLYSFILSLYRSLEQVEEITPLWFYSEIHIMRFLGFLPNFETCLRCKTPILRDEANRFDPSHGGIICPRCQLDAGKVGINIGSEELGILQFLKNSPIQAVSRLRITKNARTVIEPILKAFITYQLEQPIKSLSFLKEVME